MFAFAAGSGVWYAWTGSEKDALASAGQDATVGARLAATQIGETVDLVRASVAQVAASPNLAQAFSGSKDCALSFALAGGAESGHLDLVRTDGSVACSSLPLTGAADGHAGADWLVRALREPMLAGPVADRRTGRQALAITIPVVGHGVVGAFVDLEALGSAIATQFGGARQLEFLILSSGDTTVVTRSSQAARWIGSPVESTRFRVPTTVEASNGTDVAGVRRVYGRATVTGLDWPVYAGADRAQALASAHRLVRRQALILAAGLLAGLGATLVVNLRITGPIGRLSAGVRAATSTAGRTSDTPPIVVAGPREVTDLGRDFNDLVREVDREFDERHRAEQTAREVERSYRQLFDSNPYPMYVFDTETLAFLEVNNAAVDYYGYSRQDLLALDITRLHLAEDVAAQAEAVATDTTVDRRGPLRQVKHDGTVVEVNITSHLLSFDGRDARCSVIEDITEKAQLERRLRQSQRLESLGQLSGGVAHDFNNLLGIIIGYATMCAQDVESVAPDDPRWQTIRADLSQILRASDRATNVTRQLLSFARADIHQSQVIDLNTIVTGIEQVLRRSIGEDIDLQTHLTAQPAPIKADPGQIEQVLLNLVVNARDAMPTGGVLTIDTAPTTVDDHYAAHHPGTRVGRYLRLRVSDTGTGMSQATIDRAFEPFFTTKPKGQGTGLGLATIYGIVTQTGGHAQIYSEPGVGTTFTALFPATQDTVDTTAPHGPTTDATQYRAREHETILVVEDEDGLRLLTERILTRRGYTVIAASNGPEAIELADQHPGRIDLLLTDVIMPHMNGHDLAVHLLATRPALPVIYMSGYAEPLLASRSTLPEGVTLLSKPVTEQQIFAAIRRAIDTRRPQPARTTPA
jgi:PAS domain S-box-containing protein